MTPTRVGVWVPVTREALNDMVMDTNDFVRSVVAAQHRVVRPYEQPDPNPMPRFNWWPWIDEAAAAWRERNERISEAWSVLRYGVDEWGTR